MSQTLDKLPQDIRHEDDASKDVAAPHDGVKQLVLGLVFGIAFGFLLQKAGVAKYHVLMGQLLLTDFTVVKVMMSAVAVGAVGIHVMHRMGLTELHIKPTKLFSNGLGGIVFGLGFGLAAYCPGTGAAAIGQGNYDALAMVAGMILGSYLFALASRWVAENIDTVGNYGKLTLHQLIPAPPWIVTLGAVVTIVGALFGLEMALR